MTRKTSNEMTAAERRDAVCFGKRTEDTLFQGRSQDFSKGVGGGGHTVSK